MTNSSRRRRRRSWSRHGRAKPSWPIRWSDCGSDSSGERPASRPTSVRGRCRWSGPVPVDTAGPGIGTPPCPRTAIRRRDPGGRQDSLSTIWTKFDGVARLHFVNSLGKVRRSTTGLEEPSGRRGTRHPVARTEFPTKATHAQTRAHNASLVLRALYDLGPISRAEIARLTGLTRTSVGELVAELDGGGPGARRSVAAVHRRQGPDARLAHRRRAPHGQRWTSASDRSPPRSLNLRGEIRSDARASSRARRRRGRRGRPRADRRAARQPAQPDPRDRRRDAGHRRRRRHDPLGGQPDLDGPAARQASSPSTTTCRSIVANDSRAAAFATFLFEGEERPRQPDRDQGRARRSAPGLVLDGELFDGDGFGAGEIGHIVVEPDGAPCHCGRFGCLETVASVPAILRRAFFRAAERKPRIPQSIEAIAESARRRRRTAPSASSGPPAARSAPRSPA